jgi:3-oxoadipate enol-lactonase
MSATELIHEEAREADPGDSELGKTREQRSTRPHDVDRALDDPGVARSAVPQHAPIVHAEAGSGPVLVLVHGHPFDREMWWPQLEAFAGRFRVIAPDLRGYGESPPRPGTVTMAELSDDIWSLLDALGVDTAAVIGLSMGGLVAMEMAIERPQRLWALGLVATTAQPVTAEERRERLAMADLVEHEGIEPLVAAMAPKLFGDAPNERVVEVVLAMMRRANPVGAAAALRGRANRPDYRPALRKLGLPVFVCAGTADAWSTADVTSELVGCLRDPIVVTLHGVGHLPNLEVPDRFNDELAAFLAQPHQRGATTARR